MSWQCFMVDSDDPIAKRQIGAMWLAPGVLDDDVREINLRLLLSEEYVRDHLAQRPPLFVCLPNGEYFCVDSHYSGSTNGWTVTGEAPNITVHPSINCVGRYHGWLRDGVLSEDVEGRTFESRGAAAGAE